MSSTTASAASSGTGPPQRYWCSWALLPDPDDATQISAAASPGTLLEVGDGRITDIRSEVTTPPADAEQLHGLTVPGFANVHSHAFHRALRGRTGERHGSFWTWREVMYRAAGRLTPESYHQLARAVYTEMVLAGITCVGEFHYLHHDTDGTPYAQPNAMGQALVAAAAEAGLRITLLDVCYLHGGLDPQTGYQPLQGIQRRFGDGSVSAWAQRLDQFRLDGEHARLGTALHSVRALNRTELQQLVALHREASSSSPPVDWQHPHIHLSEQLGENTACRAIHGKSPTELLAEVGLLDRLSATLVHATHLTDTDMRLLEQYRTRLCLCPTTEADLADGLPRLGDLDLDRITVTLGSDGHSSIDMLAEARNVELNERLRTGRRGTCTATALLDAATAQGHDTLGWSDAGRLAPGYRADLVTLDTSSIRTAGLDPARAADMMLAGMSAAEVTDVVVDGRRLVRDGRHRAYPDAAQRLDATIKELLQ